MLDTLADWRSAQMGKLLLETCRGFQETAAPATATELGKVLSVTSNADADDTANLEVLAVVKQCWICINHLRMEYFMEVGACYSQRQHAL